MKSLRLLLALACLSFLTPLLGAAEWQKLITPKLDHWESLGDGLWRVTEDGTLIGYRRLVVDNLFGSGETVTKQQFEDWLGVQSWLYTKKEYGEYDLHLEYWVRDPGNSGISIRDPTRARYALTQPADYTKTPAHHGYEIQIGAGRGTRYPSGSIYTFVSAKEGVQKDGKWNSLDIESRNDIIRIRLNGQVVAEHPGDPARPKTGPIGLQLHDQFNSIMFRDIRINEAPGSP